ncbi:MAG: hypothetical protein AB8B69_00665 [Chitinophagales bacterium]
MKSKKNRRQFLKNTSLAALSASILPLTAKAKIPKEQAEEAALMCDPTTLDYYGKGPFYTENPPTIQNNQLAKTDEPGTRMIISGRVYNLDCSEYLPNVIIDIWHANDAGQYDNSAYNLRGITTSNEQGFYVFETILPGKYLNGSQFRPAHIHFKIKPPGFSELITQLYFEGDTSIANDSAASITSGEFDATSRIIPLTTNSEGKLEGTWDIVVNGDGITGINDLHLDKGLIYKINPNPFSESVTIRYGVFRHSKVSLLAYDMQGQLVANLEERTLPPEQYEAVWKPDTQLPKGHYFIILKINDLQVHYQKVVRC